MEKQLRGSLSCYNYVLLGFHILTSCNILLFIQISLPEALRCLRAYSLRPTPETVEISVNVNMALKKNKRKDAFRGTLVYPNRFGEERRVLLLAEVGVVNQNCYFRNIL